VRYSLQKSAYADSNLAGFVNLLEDVAKAKSNILCLLPLESTGQTPRYRSQLVIMSIIQFRFTPPAKDKELIARLQPYAICRQPVTQFRGATDMAYFKFVKAISEGKPIDVYNYGKMKRDFYLHR